MKNEDFIIDTKCLSDTDLLKSFKEINKNGKRKSMYYLQLI